MNPSPLTFSRNISPVVGDQINLNASQPKHFLDFDQTLDMAAPSSTQINGSEFYRNLINTFTSLNNEITASDNLTERFLVEPEKVNVHDVMIALQKAKLNLDLTRSVIQKSIEGYNTIINLR